jgi:hypothetical protein
MRPALVALLLAAAVAAGCASPPQVAAMRASAEARAAARLPGRVAVSVSGGREDSGHLTDADFKAAIEASLLSARAFEGLADAGTARYELRAGVISVARPPIGGTFPTDLEVSWSLNDRTSGAVLMRKAIASYGDSGGFSAFAGATRARHALEAAVRANIEKFIAELPKQP